METDETLQELNIGFLGCGHMGRAILSGALNAGSFSPSQVLISARSSAPETARRYNVQANTPVELLSRCDVILLGIKPQQMSSITPWVEALERSPTSAVGRPLVISMLAGVELDRLSVALPPSCFTLARVMPNLCAQVGHGVTLCYAEQSDTRGEADRVKEPLEVCRALFEPLGHVEVLEYEEQLHAATAISGCGPAYLFNLIEAMADAGVHQGLKREVALRLAAHTVWGSGMLAIQEHPAILKDRVTSPGGVTIEGVRTLEQHGARGAMIAAVIAATQRSRELADRV